MQYLAVDVQYNDEVGYATAAGVSFGTVESDKVREEHVVVTENPARYVSGEFYRRELPCILRLLELFQVQANTIIVDGYVDLGPKPGMGRYLYNALEQDIPIIGVAKNPHIAAKTAIPVLRGMSKKPLYVTAAGMDLDSACAFIIKMDGKHRIPTMLKRVDQLARNPRRGSFRYGQGADLTKSKLR
ncbi:MAG: endonuclease V [Desulfatiglans sp.]|jgi:deoxyribonuclease V|nr:endonuclease V [Desulfatiglans sp.]